MKFITGWLNLVDNNERDLMLLKAIRKGAEILLILKNRKTDILKSKFCTKRRGHYNSEIH